MRLVVNLIIKTSINSCEKLNLTNCRGAVRSVRYSQEKTNKKEVILKRSHVDWRLAYRLARGFLPLALSVLFIPRTHSLTRLRKFWTRLNVKDIILCRLLNDHQRWFPFGFSVIIYIIFYNFVKRHFWLFRPT